MLPTAKSILFTKINRSFAIVGKVACTMSTFDPLSFLTVAIDPCIEVSHLKEMLHLRTPSRSACSVLYKWSLTSSSTLLTRAQSTDREVGILEVHP